VNVGKVTKVERQEGTNAAVVHMEVEDEGLPIHADATLKIRPRIFLEGNFFVDLSPGTPQAQTIDDDDTLPITQTSTPVQLDQVLTALQRDTREDLQALLEGYGTALTARPTAAEDADQPELTKGETAAESLNDAARDGGPALRSTAIVNEALLGERPAT
jgi:ABC-type transporter Mla subunit MlaD